ncbi:1-acyl-sn-glycerol-3-phosphate acyltransferase [Paraglaciecola agarilytica]|uniref:1-acyl-sn-glycerol-3-phosphate acyltransferase n=1 Tax=Paraglaciecola chathamensis TaxID=368405 RepID=UPI001C08CA8C|nr:1-acyl-sn-glycerol-3-phosphate acyltransferase [Paraglaciecola agarilytica]MBU3019424.1 1-acyl-sn-glycerol-3-phosphate acyltransferase [Paraglaciecola agarilytica]
MNAKFDSIRPFNDCDLPQVLSRLIRNRQLMDSLVAFRFSTWPRFTYPLLRGITRLYLSKRRSSIKSLRDFQVLVEPYMERMIEQTTDSFSVSGLEDLDLSQPCIFVSNHRDIALDPAFVNWSLHQNGQDTVRIAVGDNLLKQDWVADLIRLNKCFIVNRSAKDRRQKLADAKLLSEYIFHTLKNDAQHIWIAQREGRAKDGVDATNPAIISMLSLNKPKAQSLTDYVRSLRIVPVSISYEFDPCDLSKAKELHTTEVEGSYDKADSEDIRSIVDGIVGYKGNVHVAFGKILDDEFDSAKAVAEQIDVQIKQNYKQFPSADAAVQLMGRDNCANSDSYSQTKIDEAKLHLSSRLCDESEEIKHKVLSMYAVPITHKAHPNK